MPSGDIETYQEGDVGTYDDRDAAIHEGRNLARMRQVEHIIRRMNGTIGERDRGTVTTLATPKADALETRGQDESRDRGRTRRGVPRCRPTMNAGLLSFRKTVPSSSPSRGLSRAC